MQLMSDPTASPDIELEGTETTLTVVDRDPAADAEATALVAEAKAEADRIRAEAKHEAFEMYRTASADAEQLVENARVEAEQILEAARGRVAGPEEPPPVTAPGPESPVRALSPYDIVDEPEPEAPSPFDEPDRVSRYAKHSGEIPHLGEEAGRDAVATATSLRDMLRR